MCATEMWLSVAHLAICGFFFFFFYSRSRKKKTKPIRTLLDHENLARKRQQKNKNPNPNLWWRRMRQLGGVADRYKRARAFGGGALQERGGGGAM